MFSLGYLSYSPNSVGYQTLTVEPYTEGTISFPPYPLGCFALVKPWYHVRCWFGDCPWSYKRGLFLELATVVRSTSRSPRSLSVCGEEGVVCRCACVCVCVRRGLCGCACGCVCVRCVGKLQVRKLSRIGVTKFYENQRPSTTIHYRANKRIRLYENWVVTLPWVCMYLRGFLSSVMRLMISFCLSTGILSRILSGISGLLAVNSWAFLNEVLRTLSNSLAFFWDSCHIFCK